MILKKCILIQDLKTSDSVSDSDFYVELPLSINIPDKCICYIDDIVLPVSWTMIDSRNTYVYLGLRIGETIHELRVQILMVIIMGLHLRVLYKVLSTMY